MKLGYACINLTLQNQKPKITTNRTIRREGFNKLGLSACSEKAYQNIQDLYKIVRWNADMGIEFYRMSSDMIPWASEFKLEQLPHFPGIKAELEKIKPMIKHEMENAFKMDVPLDVEIGVGENWLEAH